MLRHRHRVAYYRPQRKGTFVHRVLVVQMSGFTTPTEPESVVGFTLLELDQPLLSSVILWPQTINCTFGEPYSRWRMAQVAAAVKCLVAVALIGQTLSLAVWLSYRPSRPSAEGRA